METFLSRSWSWFNEEHIWKPFHQDHDHDEMKHLYRNLSYTIMIMIEWRTYMETFHSRSWSWLNEEYIWKFSLQDHYQDLMKKYMETFPSRSWSWFNEERIWKPFLQDHDHDLIKNIYVNLSYKIIIMM